MRVRGSMRQPVGQGRPTRVAIERSGSAEALNPALPLSPVAALRKLLKADRGGIQYVEHAEGHGDKLFAAVCSLGLEGIVSKKLNAQYRSGPSRTWIKVKNPKAQAATRAIDGTF